LGGLVVEQLLEVRQHNAEGPQVELPFGVARSLRDDVEVGPGLLLAEPLADIAYAPILGMRRNLPSRENASQGRLLSIGAVEVVVSCHDHNTVRWHRGREVPGCRSRDLAADNGIATGGEVHGHDGQLDAVWKRERHLDNVPYRTRRGRAVGAGRLASQIDRV